MKKLILFGILFVAGLLFVIFVITDTDSKETIYKLENGVLSNDKLQNEIIDKSIFDNACSRIEYTNYNPNYLSYITINDGYFIAGYTEILGTEFDFIVYKLEHWEADCQLPSTTLPDYQRPYWEVVVLKDGDVFGTITRDLIFVTAESDVDITMVFVEIDVNFNGLVDIAVFQDHTGAQMAKRYDLFIQYAGTLVNIPSFYAIWNPRIDIQNQVLLGTLRISAFSDARRIYQMSERNQVILMEELITETIQAGVNAGANRWLHQVYIGGEWQVKEFIYTDEYAIHPDDYWQYFWFGSRWDWNWYYGLISPLLAGCIRESEGDFVFIVNSEDLVLCQVFARYKCTQQMKKIIWYY